jgi:hypothetical protein
METQKICFLALRNRFLALRFQLDTYYTTFLALRSINFKS